MCTNAMCKYSHLFFELFFTHGKYTTGIGLLITDDLYLYDKVSE